MNTRPLCVCLVNMLVLTTLYATIVSTLADLADFFDSIIFNGLFSRKASKATESHVSDSICNTVRSGNALYFVNKQFYLSLPNGSKAKEDSEVEKICAPRPTSRKKTNPKPPFLSRDASKIIKLPMLAMFAGLV